MESLDFWLSRVDQHYSCHNDFQKEVSAGIGKFDRVLISDREAFKTSLEKFIADIHLRHKRCKPILIEYGYQSSDGKDQTYRIMSAGQTFVTMQIINVRNAQRYSATGWVMPRSNFIQAHGGNYLGENTRRIMPIEIELNPDGSVKYFEQNPIFGDETDSDAYKP